MENKKISKECIHCGLCTQNCSFLKKYEIDLNEFENRLDLAYNCFMCGKCKLVCPKNIDGRSIAMYMREKVVEKNNGKIPERGYRGLLLEKKDYIFKNYKNVDIAIKTGDKNISKEKKIVLFTGCNFLSYMPNTADTLIKKMKEKGIGVVFDCCGKPIYELGLNNDSKKIIDNLEKRFKENSIYELIVVCPNCYYYLKDRINIKITDIYTKMKELSIGREMSGEIFLFRPCPDREEEILLNIIKDCNKNLSVVCLDEQCCGAGGCASVKEGQLANNMKADIKSQASGKSIKTYCSTCFGFFKSESIDVNHLLSDMLDIKEIKKTNSLLNRMKYRFYK